MQVDTFPNAIVVRLRDATSSFKPLVRFVNGSAVVTPIDFGPPSDELFLLLFGTGIRGRSSPAAVRALVDDVEVPVEYAGPQGQFAGVDQINIRLPRSRSFRPSKFPFFTVVVDGVHVANAEGDNVYLPLK